MRRLLLLASFGIALAATGCGGAGERGKNKDFDRPTVSTQR